MEPYRDYLSKKDLGIRIKGDKTCRVVRVFQGEWIEFGPEYTLPMRPELLQWTPPGIPPSTLAVALKIYELDNLWTDLRNVLSGQTEPVEPKGPRNPKSFPGKPRQSKADFLPAQKRLVRPV
jgi:hypothetical protein